MNPNHLGYLFQHPCNLLALEPFLDGKEFCQYVGCVCVLFWQYFCIVMKKKNFEFFWGIFLLLSVN
jgi:hypothetical protein